MHKPYASSCMASIGMVLLSIGPACAQDILVAEEEPAAQAAREAQFSQELTGATLRGFFTVSDDEAEGTPKLHGDRYDLTNVQKVDDGHWLFEARIRYGDHDVTLPMTLPVEWAGDTPVVVIDNIGFPGLGTYSGRVLFHHNHYSGQWSGANHGGFLFGTIQHGEPTAAPSKPSN